MKQGTIAGPFVPLYPEVILKLRDKVKAKSHGTRWVYFVLISLFPVEEDWDTDDPVWVTGTIRASKIDIAKESGVGWKGFSRLWQQLIDAGLVQETEDGLFKIPYYKKRAYDSISAREVRERLSQLEKSINANEPDPDGRDPNSDDPLNEGDLPLKEDDHPLNEDDHPLNEDSKGSAILIGGLKEEYEEEEEGGVAPGSRKWIIDQADQLWPGRGFKPETDAGYIEELEKFDVAELEAAFKRARADKVKYGNFDYLLNYLRNPALYNKKRTAKGKSKQQKGKPEHDPDIGRLNAPWLDAEKGG